MWVVDKKAQGGQLGYMPQPDWDAVVTVARNDATALTRLKHPAVVQASLCFCLVWEPLSLALASMYAELFYM